MLIITTQSLIYNNITTISTIIHFCANMDSPTSTIAASPTESWSSGCASASTLIDPFGSNPLAEAVFSGNVEQVQALINQGTEVGRENLWILHEACLQGINLFQALGPGSHAEINTRLPGEGGDNIFHRVLRCPPFLFKDDKMETIKTLLRIGADPLACDRLGDTILHFLAGSINNGSCELLAFILKNKEECRKSIDKRNYYGNTPLIIAVLYHRRHCAQTLLQYGANRHLRGEYGMTALEFAEVMRNRKIIELLQN